MSRGRERKLSVVTPCHIRTYDFRPGASQIFQGKTWECGGRVAPPPRLSALGNVGVQAHSHRLTVHHGSGSDVATARSDEHSLARLRRAKRHGSFNNKGGNPVSFFHSHVHNQTSEERVLGEKKISRSMPISKGSCTDLSSERVT